MLDRWFSTNNTPGPGEGTNFSALAVTSFTGNTASVPANLTCQASMQARLTLPAEYQILQLGETYDGTNGVSLIAYPSNWTNEGLTLTNVCMYVSMDIRSGDLAAVGSAGSASAYFQVCTNLESNCWSDDTVPRSIQMWFSALPESSDLVSVTSIARRGGIPYAVKKYDLNQDSNGFNYVFADMLLSSIPVTKQKRAEFFRLRFTP